MLTVLYVYLMYLNADVLVEVKDIGLQSHDDIIKWGKGYINFNFTATKDNVITYEAFDDEPEETDITTSVNSTMHDHNTSSFNSTTTEV